LAVVARQPAYVPSVAVELDALLEARFGLLQPQAGWRLQSTDGGVQVKAGRWRRGLDASPAGDPRAGRRDAQPNLLPSAEARLVAQPGVQSIQLRRFELLDHPDIAVEGEGQVGAVDLVFTFERAWLVEPDRLPMGGGGQVHLVLLSV